MIISRTPFRVSFFGGGTDYHPWYQEHGGAVLSTTINRYCYINCRFLPPFFDYRNRVVWSKIETVNTHDDIAHPVVREVLRMMDLEGVEIHHDGDLPSRSGLGSSSSFTVGILHALNALKGKMSSKEQLAKTAIHVERGLLKENVGIQDQIAAAYGGLNRIDIRQDGGFSVNPLIMDGERLRILQDSLMLVYTGTSRFSSNIAKSQIQAIPNKLAQLHRMYRMVEEGAMVLQGSGEIDDFGRLLHESWQLKRQLTSSISPGFVDQIYDQAISAGALGGKLLGAGGGGFMLFFVNPNYRDKVLKALDQLLVVPIEFDSTGSQIILYAPDHFSQHSLSGAKFSHNLDRPQD